MQFIPFFCFVFIAIRGVHAFNASTVPAIDIDTFRKVLCVKNIFTPGNFSTITGEAVYEQYCEKFATAVKCFTTIEKFQPERSKIEVLLDDAYDCHTPFLSGVNSLCSIGYKSAKDARKCWNAGLEYFVGSKQEAMCRKKCCRTDATYNPAKPYLCVPDKTSLYLSCEAPQFNEDLQSNACQASCMTAVVARYAKSHCTIGVSSIFQSFSKGMRKNVVSKHKCFNSCDF